MSRVEFNKCDNCERRFEPGDSFIEVTVGCRTSDHGSSTPLSDLQTMFIRMQYTTSTTPESAERDYEFCSPRCVVAAFIAAGAISNEVTL